MKQECIYNIVRNVRQSLFTPSQLPEYMIMFHRYRSCMLRDGIIINLNLKLININLPLWDCSGIIQNMYYMFQQSLRYGMVILLYPLVAGVMVVTQYHSADPPIVRCNNIWLSGLLTDVTLGLGRADILQKIYFLHSSFCHICLNDQEMTA